MKKILLIIVIGLVVLAVYSQQSVKLEKAVHFSLDLPAIRALATASNESLPQEIGLLQIASIPYPSFFVLGTGGFDMIDLHAVSYQIRYPQQYVIIDPVHDEQTHQELVGFGGYNTANAQLLQSMLPGASAIVVTHEHFDHAGGITASSQFAQIAPQVNLTTEQLSNEGHFASGLSAEQKALLQPLSYDQYYRLKPGIVLIKTPGHTPGSQMIYVQRQDGEEFLFIGDIAWNFAIITEGQPHPHLTNWVVGEDGQQLAEQIAYLHQLHMDHPEIHIVAGHDKLQQAQYLRAGFFSQGMH